MEILHQISVVGNVLCNFDWSWLFHYYIFLFFIFFSQDSQYSPVLWYRVLVRVDFPFHRMDTAFMSKISWYPAFHFIPIDTNVLFANPGRVRPSQTAPGSWVDARQNSVDNFMQPLVVILTVVGGGG